MRAAVIFLALLLSIGPAAANIDAQSPWDNGTNFLETCPAIDKQSDVALDHYNCVAYMTGFAQSFFLYKTFWANHLKFDDDTTAPGPCPPKGAIMGQYYAITYRYILSHPERRQQPTAMLAGLALAEAWPCSKSTPDFVSRAAFIDALTDSYIHHVDNTPRAICVGSVCFYWKPKDQPSSVK